MALLSHIRFSFLVGILYFISIEANAAQKIKQCRSYTIYDSHGYAYSGHICWDTWTGGAPTQGSTEKDSRPYSEPSSGTNSNSLVYSGNSFDKDGDTIIDCWKDATASGNYNLNSQQDFGPRNSGWHSGIDIAATKGTPIYAPAFMLITKVEKYGVDNVNRTQRGNGAHVRGIFIHNGTQYEAVMIHMENGSASVRQHQAIYPGTHIGNVNNTGGSHGNHLHLQIWEWSYIPHPDASPFDKNPEIVRQKRAIDPQRFFGEPTCSKNKS